MIDQHTEQKIEKIIGGDANMLVQYAEQLGKRFAPQHMGEKNTKLSSSQIRNILDDVQRIFDDVQRMKEFDPKPLIRLRPKIAYAAGKTKPNNSLRELQPILDKAIEKTDSKDKFTYFKEFFEAIVGYHRYHSKIREA
jgi:CRISPR-associated protein Csm2